MGVPVPDLDYGSGPFHLANYANFLTRHAMVLCHLGSLGFRWLACSWVWIRVKALYMEIRQFFFLAGSWKSTHIIIPRIHDVHKYSEVGKRISRSSEFILGLGYLLVHGELNTE